MRFFIVIISLILCSCNESFAKESAKNNTSNLKLITEDDIENVILKKFPEFYKTKSIKGEFNSDNNLDYLFVLEQKENKKITSKCIIVFGALNISEVLILEFDDLLPSINKYEKIDDPFENIQFTQNILYLTFTSSEIGHNEIIKESFTFKFNNQKHFFTLINLKYETCVLPDCETFAAIELTNKDLVDSNLIFSMEKWVMDGGVFSSKNTIISPTNLNQWKKFSTNLNIIGLIDKSIIVEERILN